jgi:hypothetical protein
MEKFHEMIFNQMQTIAYDLGKCCAGHILQDVRYMLRLKEGETFLWGINEEITYFINVEEDGWQKTFDLLRKNPVKWFALSPENQFLEVKAEDVYDLYNIKVWEVYTFDSDGKAILQSEFVIEKDAYFLAGIFRGKGEAGFIKETLEGKYTNF